MAPTIPRRATDRIQSAIHRGYLLTSGVRGCGDWLIECRLRQRPMIIVVRDRNHCRLHVEMERWRLTDIGQALMTALLAEHGAANVVVLPDAVFAYRLPQWAAELIAGRLVAWVRAAEAELKGAAR